MPAPEIKFWDEIKKNEKLTGIRCLKIDRDEV